MIHTKRFTFGREWKLRAAVSRQSFFRLHPSHGTRIKDLEAHMPEAVEIYGKAPHAPVSELPSVGTR